jgi:hypothetical protein
MIPRDNNGIRSWAHSFIALCDTNKTVWGIPTDTVTTLHTLWDNYDAALAKALAPDTHSKPATTAKEEAKKTLRDALIVFVAKYIDNNDIITIPIREQLGLPVKDRKHTSIPTPTTYPEFFIKVKDIRTLEIHFKPVGSVNRGRPYGYNGAIICFAVLESPPKDINELTHSLLATRTPYTLTFTEAERGKHVYIALFWENEKGEKGPYSQIEEAIIP